MGEEACHPPAKTSMRSGERGITKHHTKLTWRGEIVLDAILSSSNPLSPPEIHTMVWNGDATRRIALATVYRTLEQLLDDDMVSRPTL